MQYLIGLDIGTSAIKGVLLAADGSDRYCGKVRFDYDTEREHQVEIPAARYLNACYDLFQDLTSHLPPDGTLAGISAASASGNLLVLGENGEPATPIYNWQDSCATEEQCNIPGAPWLDKDAYYAKIGWGFSPDSFPLAQLCRVRAEQPGLLQRSPMICMSTEYLFYKLTGKWGIAPSAGTPFYLLDQETGDYIPETLAALGIRKEQLPPCGKTGALLGSVLPNMTARTGIPAGTPVFLGTFDHPSAARGVGVVREGQMLLSCGTSWVGLCPVNDRNRIIAGHTLCDPFLSEQGGPWATMVSVASVSSKIGALVRKYVCSEGNVFEEFARQAEMSVRGAHGLVINPADPPEEAEVRKYPVPDIARAIMEGTAELLKFQLQRLSRNNITADSAIMVGGPSETPFWATVLTECLGIPVSVCQGAHAGAIGSAIVAGISAGIFADVEAGFRALS